jgi:hypothetical protein
MSSIYPSPYALEAVFFTENRKPLATLVIGHYWSLDSAKTEAANAEVTTPAIVEEIEGSLAAFRKTAVRAEYRIKG